MKRPLLNNDMRDNVVNVYHSRRVELFELADELGIDIRNVIHPLQATMLGIHLLSPNLDELADAIQTAERDQFSVIWIHSNATFKGARK